MLPYLDVEPVLQRTSLARQVLYYYDYARTGVRMLEVPSESAGFGRARQEALRSTAGLPKDELVLLDDGIDQGMKLEAVRALAARVGYRWVMGEPEATTVATPGEISERVKQYQQKLEALQQRINAYQQLISHLVTEEERRRAVELYQALEAERQVLEEEYRALQHPSQ